MLAVAISSRAAPNLAGDLDILATKWIKIIIDPAVAQAIAPPLTG